MPSQYLEHHGIQIARGDMVRYSSIHKLGAVPAMSQNNSGTVWDISDTLYPWTALDTPAVINVERNDVLDNGHTVTIQGLDSNWNFQEETVTISGADTLGTKLFRRVNRAFYTDGSLSNTGNIDLEAGAAGGTTVARITAGQGQTLMAVHTVPANYKAYIMQGVMTCQAGADASGFMYVRYNTTGAAFRVAHTFEISGGGPYIYPFTTPIEIPEKSDIDVRATVRSNNARITAAFDMVLFKFRGSL